MKSPRRSGTDIKLKIRMNTSLRSIETNARMERICADECHLMAQTPSIRTKINDRFTPKSGRWADKMSKGRKRPKADIVMLLGKVKIVVRAANTAQSQCGQTIRKAQSYSRRHFDAAGSVSRGSGLMCG